MEEEDGTFEVLTKKEVQGLRHEKGEARRRYLGGIKDMNRLPGALFVVDPRARSVLRLPRHAS